VKRRRLLLAIFFIAMGPVSVFAGEVSKADADFFEKKIRPVLVKHCYECHSAKSKELGGKLLLDSPAGMLQGGESGPSVQAGKPDASLIIQALRYDDIEMPPEKPLPENVVNDFITWVKRGAPDPRHSPKVTAKKPEPEGLDPELHWSFFPRTTTAPPAVADKSWPRSDIDRFVLSKIEQARLHPTADAPPATLIRRLYYDLTGLPPAHAAVRQFEDEFAASGQLAVQRLVDRLLLSPQFGQRWGRHWLDVARYGESNGDDGLGRNASFPHAWRYRDYVISALNQDTPYDQFLREQIAGDMLPASSAAQRNRQLVATGFLAIGSKPASAMNKNFAMDIVDDQINVVSTTVMGLSVACARCHDHKHDPVPTRDYYAMAGIFKSTETLYGRAADEKLTAPPTPLHTLVSRWNEKQPPVKLLKKTPQFPPTYTAAIDSLKPFLHERLSAKPTSLQATGKAAYSDNAFAAVNGAELKSEFASPARSYSVAFWFKNDTANNKRPITAYLFSLAKPGAPKTGDHLGIGGTHEKDVTGKLFLFNGSDSKQKKLIGATVIQPGTWNHVVLVREGDHLRLYLNGVDEPEFAGKLAATYKDSRTFFAATRSDKFAPLAGNLAELAVFDRTLNAKEAALLHQASGQPKGARPERPAGLAMGVRERAKPQNCKVHINGETGKYGPLAPRGFLSAHVRSGWADAASLASIAAESSGRKELVNWLTDPDHPQTARVMVNRVWLHLFGQAIVATPDDFGVYGARPTHPLLLDYLASGFVRQGWSIKKLIRKIVLSRTYQLDSRVDAKLAKADSSNALYTRHRRRRLDAESLRDSLLTAAGDIDLSPGEGSAVDKTVALINRPAGNATNFHHESRRRSVYLCMLRHAPPPELAAFDLPTGVTIAGQRNVTTLPSQTLFLLNSPFVVGQANSLAASLLEDAGGSATGETQAAVEGRIHQVYQRVLQRPASPGELRRGAAYVKKIEAGLPSNTDAITRRLQAWGSLCQAVFASSEFRYVD